MNTPHTEQKITQLECEIMQSQKSMTFEKQNIAALLEALTDAVDANDYHQALQTLTSLYAPLQRAATQQAINYKLRQVQESQ